MQEAATQTTRTKRGRRKLWALLAAMAVSSTLVVVGLQSGAFAGYYDLAISGDARPSTVAEGGQVGIDLTVENFGYGVAKNVVVEVVPQGGTWNLPLTKAAGGTGCKIEQDSEATESISSALVCKLGNMQQFTTKQFKVILDTAGLDPDDYSVDFWVSSQGFTSAGGFTEFEVIEAQENVTITYVPPGKSTSVGPKNPTEDDPAVAKLALPKKILVEQPNGKLKLENSPGAAITLKESDASNEPVGCGGEQCDAKIIELLSEFPGYIDPKHPVFLTVSFYGPSYTPGSILYIIKEGVGVPVPKCVKVKGAYTNTPCVAKERVVKKKGQIVRIDDKIALLSGDPSVGRR